MTSGGKESHVHWVAEMQGFKAFNILKLVIPCQALAGV